VKGQRGVGMIKVSIIEDDARFADLVEQALLRDQDMRVVGKYRCAEEALLEIPKTFPDVVLMDISLPGISGIECLRRLKHSNMPGQVLMLTWCEDDQLVFESLRAGAEGYITKDGTLLDRLGEAIRNVTLGGGVLTSSIARKVIGYFRQPMGGSMKPANLEDTLSPREIEVLRNLAVGRTYKEIAGSLSISLDTVRKHTGHIYQKLHVRSRTEAAGYYLENSHKM